MKGTRVGSYIIEDQIGEGGMGVVYSAKHCRMNRVAVVKVLRQQFVGSPELAKRFENEANAAASIGHPGIVQVFDIGQHEDGFLYIVMEMLHGESLQARLDRVGRLPPEQATAIIRQAAGALGAAHAIGIVHRDLKPDNLFIVPDPEVSGGERVKLLDFGIAKLAAPEAGGMVTATGIMMGTPHYMSPEQCQGAGGVDTRSDLYSLGCMFFQLLTGRPPFDGRGAGDFVIAHMTTAPPTLRSLIPDIPAKLDDIVARLLIKAPEERLGTTQELISALDDATSAGHIRAGGDTGQGQTFEPVDGVVPLTGAHSSGLAATNIAAPTPANSSVFQKQQPVTTMGASAGQSLANPALANPALANLAPGNTAPVSKRVSRLRLVSGIAAAFSVVVVTLFIVVYKGDDSATNDPVAAANVKNKDSEQVNSGDSVPAQVHPADKPQIEALIAEPAVDSKLVDSKLQESGTSPAEAKVSSDAANPQKKGGKPDGGASKKNAKVVRKSQGTTKLDQTAPEKSPNPKIKCLLEPSSVGCPNFKLRSPHQGEADGLPERPKRAGLKAEFSRVQRRLSACMTKMELPAGTEVLASIKIDGDGKVTSVVLNNGGQKLQKCVAATVKRSKFPKSKKGININIPIRFDR